ncbi:MAG: hypothetical protein ACRD5H_13610, partial [Nitrososphaerales archaeon]
ARAVQRCEVHLTRRIVQEFRNNPEKPIAETKEQVLNANDIKPLKSYLPPRVVQEVQRLAKEEKKSLAEIIPQVVEKGVRNLETRKELLQNRSFLKEATDVYIKSTYHRSGRDSGEYDTGEPPEITEVKMHNEALSSYYNFIHHLITLSMTMKIESDPPELRQRGWLQIAKQLETGELNKAVYEHIQKMVGELRMVERMFLDELEKRKKMRV